MRKPKQRTRSPKAEAPTVRRVVRQHGLTLTEFRSTATMLAVQFDGSVEMAIRLMGAFETLMMCRRDGQTILRDTVAHRDIPAGHWVSISLSLAGDPKSYTVWQEITASHWEPQGDRLI